MPHECTTCGRTFEDGSKEMLSGCPDCGGNKFQFHPAGSSTSPAGSSTPSPTLDADDPDTAPSGDPGTPPGDDGIEAEEAEDVEPDSSFTFGSTPSGERGSDDDPEGADVVPDEPPTAEEPQVKPREDRAQASARSTVVSEDELPRGEPAPEEPVEASGADSDDPEHAGSERPDLSELREELNEQFESIKIHRRGEYELNLMELYDREERIIALEEDGRYAIDVPTSWRETDDDE